jgi:hypothetical protein
MNRQIKTGAWFSKAEGSPSWKDRLTTLRGKKPPKSTAKLEVDDANGETLIFPEIGDVSEIAEGIAVTATDGDHVFTADSTTYNVVVEGGKVTGVTETPIQAEASEMSAETAEFVEAVALELEANAEFKTTAGADIAEMKTQLATALNEIKTLKATMSHKTPKEGEGDDDDKKSVSIGGKKINLNKLNLK